MTDEARRKRDEALFSRGQFSELDREFMDGYCDGRDPNAPEPSANRTDAYRLSFEVGRAELAGCPIPASISRAKAAQIEAAWDRLNRAMDEVLG